MPRLARLQVADKVQLRVGDGVELVVAVDARSGKRTGHQVRRTEEAAPPPEHADAPAADGGGERGADRKLQPQFLAERNPNAVKYTGHKLVGPPSSPIVSYLSPYLQLHAPTDSSRRNNLKPILTRCGLTTSFEAFRVWPACSTRNLISCG